MKANYYNKRRNKESADDKTSNSLTEVLTIFFVTVVILGMFFKILFG